MLGRIIGVIIATFMIAAFYGLFCTAMDFMGSNYQPVHSGHRAAAGVYGLFGVVSEEIQNNEPHETSNLTSIARKIAAPYAVTADLSAILGGKLILACDSFFHAAEHKADQVAPTGGQ
jgi:hypothetical protein